MNIISLKKHHINTQKAKVKLSGILSKTRQRTSAMVKFWKHIGQIIRERIPLLSPIQELITGKGFVSGVKIIPYSLSRRGRVLIICTEGIFAYILIRYGNHIIQEAKHNITNILIHQQFPHHLSVQIVFLMIVMIIGSLGYYGMIKPGDFKQAIKEHQEEYE